MRGLIVLVLVIGGGLGWVVREAHMQRDAVAAVVKAGGTVLYDWRRLKVDPGGSAAERATTYSFSTNALHITQAIAGVEKLALRLVGASIALVCNGTGVTSRKPLIDFRFPAVMQVVSGLEAPGDILDVLEGRPELPALAPGGTIPRGQRASIR
jgi:hypothetical protein